MTAAAELLALAELRLPKASDSVWLGGNLSTPIQADLGAPFAGRPSLTISQLESAGLSSVPPALIATFPEWRQNVLPPQLSETLVNVYVDDWLTRAVQRGTDAEARRWLKSAIRGYLGSFGRHSRKHDYLGSSIANWIAERTDRFGLYWTQVHRDLDLFDRTKAVTTIAGTLRTGVYTPKSLAERLTLGRNSQFLKTGLYKELVTELLAGCANGAFNQDIALAWTLGFDAFKVGSLDPLRACVERSAAALIDPKFPEELTSDLLLLFKGGRGAQLFMALGKEENCKRELACIRTWLLRHLKRPMATYIVVESSENIHPEDEIAIAEGLAQITLAMRTDRDLADISWLGWMSYSSDTVSLTRPLSSIKASGAASMQGQLQGAASVIGTPKEIETLIERDRATLGLDEWEFRPLMFVVTSGVLETSETLGLTLERLRKRYKAQCIGLRLTDVGVRSATSLFFRDYLLPTMTAAEFRELLRVHYFKSIEGELLVGANPEVREMWRQRSEKESVSNLQLPGDRRDVTVRERAYPKEIEVEPLSWSGILRYLVLVSMLMGLVSLFALV